MAHRKLDEVIARMNADAIRKEAARPTPPYPVDPVLLANPALRENVHHELDLIFGPMAKWMAAVGQADHAYSHARLAVSAAKLLGLYRDDDPKEV